MYPRKYSEEIADALLKAHPRGWAFIQQLFYIRPDGVWKIFALDQRLWYELKKLIKFYDEKLKWCTIDYSNLTPLSGLPVRMTKFANFLSHADYLDDSDELDILLFQDNA